MYIYPENLKAKAALWLWALRDVAVIGVGLLISILALALTRLLCAIPEVRLLALDSRESFQMSFALLLLPRLSKQPPVWAEQNSR